MLSALRSTSATVPRNKSTAQISPLSVSKSTRSKVKKLSLVCANDGFPRLILGGCAGKTGKINSLSTSSTLMRQNDSAVLSPSTLLKASKSTRSPAWSQSSASAKSVT